MAILLQQAMLMTMSEQGSFRGDVLIADGRIRQIAPAIRLPSGMDVTMMDGRMLTALPGLTDAGLGMLLEGLKPTMRTAGQSGVTAGLIRTDESSMLFCGDQCLPGPFALVKASELPQAQLEDALKDAQESSRQLLCIARTTGDCTSLCAAVIATGVRPVLLAMGACIRNPVEIAACCCAVIIAPAAHGRGEIWRSAARIDALGVPVAISCGNYPHRLPQLLSFAAQCCRAGMPRERALMAITRSPAQILGLDAGVLSEGCAANLILLDGDPLLMATRHLITISAGNVIKTNPGI